MVSGGAAPSSGAATADSPLESPLDADADSSVAGLE
jgi:hypothetical protein